MAVTAPPPVGTAPERSGARRAGIATAFTVAAALGVGIGLASVPGGASGGAAGGGPPTAGTADGSTLLPRPSPAAQQRPGRARLLRLAAADRAALRRAYFEAYPRGGTGATGRDPRPEDVVIPKGTVFYGEVAGPDPGADTFWAVGPVYVKGPHGDPDRAVPQVWKRAGGGPWVYAGAGPAGGCAQVPAPLRALWERSPCPP